MPIVSPIPEPAQDEAALQRFIERGHAITGFLKGEIGAPLPDWHHLGQDNGAMLKRLHAALAQRYPEAGAAFWAVRVWTNITWQPAYLAVIGIHMQGVLPDLRGLSQKGEGIHIDGYRLLPGVEQAARHRS